jgi:hypothetical protein
LTALAVIGVSGVAGADLNAREYRSRSATVPA